MTVSNTTRCSTSSSLVLWHDLSALAGVGGQHAVVTNEVPPRWRDDGGQARDEIERLKHDGVRAVLPSFLEPVPHTPTGVLLKPIGRERRATRADAEVEEHTLDVVTLGGYLDDAHAAGAARSVPRRRLAIAA